MTSAPWTAFVGRDVGAPVRRPIGPSNILSRTSRRPMLDASRRPIGPGELVEVPVADWSRGIPKWMTEVSAEVVRIGRTRVEVRFAGHERTHAIPVFGLRVIVSAHLTSEVASPIDT